jgi:hypothetical protein
MEERTVEKRTEITREDRVDGPKKKTTNVNIAPDGSTQVQEQSEDVDEPVGSTVVRHEETIERDRA